MQKSKKAIKVGLSGASGRMGRAVKSLIDKKNSGFLLVAKAPESSLDSWESGQVQGVIDFSLPGLFAQTLKWCVDHKKPFVSGTTGLSSQHKSLLKRAQQKIPVFYEENMSYGIWQIKKWISSVSADIDSVLLEDIHHKHKKDKPSGTALKLKKHFPLNLQKKLQIKSVRKGDVFGTHNIVFKREEEWISIQHKALSRRLFAGGALKALKWLKTKPPGLYSFEDLYILK